ncbi:DEAD/DEAH box helicase [Candidatus Nomurabacteria bacterium]|uniref:DEAD/DEAH box helicase n=1 Tax=candidate division WWE3 bacterium TaxID=2053526 RepID=A0A955IWC6_UNCKA|nr:DEAD/DEAH box helicase [candidate division WWE3 bacterium]MCB9823950.1 DEAD/DEAH box helicase [Candidatus Nomurabacteria bacterium]MCB9827069.1 DEAD/DEAH box helicase [Candidatus Nomurabacteria bacterium]MCB9827889.1 DEAD/DEAH box helicase [Candidatus Nomurabacteria bacterium]
MNTQKQSKNRRYSSAPSGARPGGFGRRNGGYKGKSKFSTSSGSDGESRGGQRSGNSFGYINRSGEQQFSKQGRSRDNWKRKNRRKSSEVIDHSRYISKPVQAQLVEACVIENSFRDFNLHPTLLKNISDRGYIQPTKIQDMSIPHILKGRDVLGTGNTGTGKTGAFLIPMCQKVLKNPENRVLIITPTRELASQIQVEFRKFTRDTKLRMVLVIGGESMHFQMRALREKPQFVVATPGRLMDLEKRNQLSLKGFTNIILDEVDQMLDMGFVEDIKIVCGKLPENRQSLFFSATMAGKEEALANTLLRDPVKVEADKQSPLNSIHQDIVKVASKEHKIQILHDLLKKTEFTKVLVFSGTRIGADRITQELRSRGVMVDSLHGNKSQRVRTKVLTNFRTDKIDVLVATDVAARGIDVPDISHVINFDEPVNYNDYIHRIGRTGRVGKKGTALTFVVSKSFSK